MFLIPEVLVLLILNGLLLFFGFIAFVLSVKIFIGWDRESTSSRQYKLERQSFLVATIIKYIFIVKIPLFLFFVFTMDKISDLITGAMCAAGVVDATAYGMYLFIFKILNIYLFGFWLVLHTMDSKKEELPYTKIKFGFFALLFFLLALEIVIEILMFGDIDIDKMVSCCGTLYSQTSETTISAIFAVSGSWLAGIFYLNYALVVLGYFLKNRSFFSIFSFALIPVAIISLIAFFGTYIYELPTHHCPFCFLQKDYYYVGYVLYTTLFLGTFFGVLTAFVNNKRYFFYGMLFNTVYMALVSYYLFSYYIRNGVWL